MEILLWLLLGIIILIFINELVSTFVYGTFISYEQKEEILNIDTDRLQLNSFNSSILCIWNWIWISEEPLWILCKYYIDWIWRVPRWSLAHKKIQEYYAIAMKK